MSNIDMDEAKAKLLRLDELLPQANGYVYQFGCFLAESLNDVLCPTTFLAGYVLAVKDLQRGVDGFGFPIEPEYADLVDQPPEFYDRLIKCVILITETVLPAHFAAEVKTLFSELREPSPL